MPKCLGAELSGHFGTSAEVSSGHFGTVLVPKCLGSEVSGYLSMPRFQNDMTRKDGDEVVSQSRGSS